MEEESKILITLIKRQREIIIEAQDNANELEKYQPLERDYNLPFVGSSKS